MSSELTVIFSYSHESHSYAEGVDTAFYSMLPNVKYQYSAIVPSKPARMEMALPRIEQPRKGMEQIIQVLGTTVLTSTALAGIIKAYLEYKTTKLKIEIGATKVEFEGPSLSESTEQIESILENLIQTQSLAQSGKPATVELLAVPKSETLKPKQ
jgi:hypothetical protein